MRKFILNLVMISIFILKEVPLSFAQLEEGQIQEQASLDELVSSKHVYPEDFINIEQTCYLEKLDKVLTVFQSVPFDIYNLSAFSESIKRTGDMTWAKNVLDIGTGAGSIAFLLIGYGAKKVVGTDIDPLAIKNAKYNARNLGLEEKFEARLVPMNDTSAYSVIAKDEKFDLIVSDPPQTYNADLTEYLLARSAKQNYYMKDPGGKLLSSMIIGLKDHLAENGRAWISLHNYLSRQLFLQLVKENDLNAKTIFSGLDDLNYSSIQFLRPLPLTKQQTLYNGKSRMMNVKIYELTAKKQN